MISGYSFSNKLKTVKFKQDGRTQEKILAIPLSFLHYIARNLLLDTVASAFSFCKLI